GAVRRRGSADHARRPVRRPCHPTRRGDPVTTHPIDTEALRREALGQLGLAAMDPRWPGRVLSLLDALAAAEHRATRAEAQSAIRGRAVVIYRERAREAEAERDCRRRENAELCDELVATQEYGAKLAHGK